jgi:hypothetical protein
MNPARLTSSVPPTRETVLPASRTTIIKVELPQQSTRRYDVIRHTLVTDTNTRLGSRPHSHDPVVAET